MARFNSRFNKHYAKNGGGGPPRRGQDPPPSLEPLTPPALSLVIKD